MTSISEEEQGATTTLPDNWEMRVDTRTGMPYYLNHAKQFTTWDDPRLVENPRGMLNNMGSMLRRSASPTPVAARSRGPAEVEYTSIPFNHFLEPAQQASSLYHSLPRRDRFPQPPFGRDMMNNDSWFRSGFDEPNESFFDDPTWPIKSHSMRLRHQSPFRTSDLGSEPGEHRGRVSREGTPHRDSISIPITSQARSGEEPAEEQVIIPSQYKKGEGQEGITADHVISRRDSPRPKQAKQEEVDAVEHSDSNPNNETVVLQRVQSQYDNNNSENTNDECDCDQLSIASDKQERQEVGSQAGDEVDAAVTQTKEEVEPTETDNMADMERDDSTVNEDNCEDGVEPETNLQSDVEESYKAIDRVRSEVDGYKQEVEKFSDVRDSKQYRYLDEMLTRCQLALDDVSTFGDIELRRKRKETVNYIESVLSLLESRSTS